MRKWGLSFFGAAGLVVLIFGIAGCQRHPQEKRKLVIMGIDSGTWTIISPLVQAGKMPNFQHLIEQGASGELITFRRTHISPVLWTSMLTGKHPDKTGIKGFISAKGFPVNSTMRKVKDLAEILSEQGYRVGFVGFWASWPAEKVRGWMVSDLLSLGRYKDSGPELNYRTMDYSYLLNLKETTYPEDFIKEIYPLLLSPDQVPRESFEKLAAFNDQEWDRFQKIQLVSREDFESLLKFSLVSDLNFQRVALYLAEQKKPEVLAVYFEGPDIVGHFFWKYMEPEYFTKAPARDLERFRDTLRNYYQLMDGYLGELIQASGPDTAFLIVSDHGMKRVSKEGAVGLQSGAHTQSRVNGIIIFSGPGIKKGQRIQAPRILDLTPTALYYLGLPVGEDMDGKVLTEAFSEDFLKSHPVERIRSYDQKPRSLKEQRSPLDRELVNKLKSIGYIR